MSQVFTAAGAGDPIPIYRSGVGDGGTIYCVVAPGSVLEYNVEVSPELIDRNDPNPPPRTWLPADDAWTGLTASRVGPLGVGARAVRINITSFTNGSLAFSRI